ncbi:MAG TPA: tetratricopeptide repeat protein [Bryobacteraceae bacterium]|nr:tetratricopeptide repeat protein [Bryobacteraceae bacterium]
MLHSLFLLLFAVPQQATASSALKQGLIALQSGDLKRAQAEFEDAANADPSNPFVWTSLAETELRLGDTNQALASAAKAESTASGKPVVWHALAMFYAHAGNFKAAADWEAKYAASAQASPDALSSAAMLALRAEDFQRAATLAESGLQRSPRDPQLNLTLGVARYGQRRFEDAITCFLRVISIDPSIEQPYVFLGRMLDQAGPHLSEITSASERWLERSPENAQAHLVLAKALLQSDPRSTRAEQLLRESIHLDPKDWEAHYELGVLLENRHAYPEAAAELQLAITENANQPMPHYHLARVYDRLGKPDEAKAQREIHQRLTSGKTSNGPGSGSAMNDN